MTRRRDLSFTNLGDVMPDVERLLAGHVTVCRWSLGEILHHLAMSIRLTMERPPGSSERTREQDVARRRFFRRDRFPDGVEVPHAALVPPRDPDATIQAAALRRAIGQFLEIAGPFAPHPVLGPLTREEWGRFHCLHCAHHLGFALPA